MSAADRDLKTGPSPSLLSFNHLPSASMTVARAALLIVDVQYDFIDGSLAVPGAREILHEVVALIEGRQWDMVVASQVCLRRWSSARKDFLQLADSFVLSPSSGLPSPRPCLVCFHAWEGTVSGASGTSSGHT